MFTNPPSTWAIVRKEMSTTRNLIVGGGFLFCVSFAIFCDVLSSDIEEMMDACNEMAKHDPNKNETIQEGINTCLNVRTEGCKALLQSITSLINKFAEANKMCENKKSNDGLADIGMTVFAALATISFLYLLNATYRNYKTASTKISEVHKITSNFYKKYPTYPLNKINADNEIYCPLKMEKTNKPVCISFDYNDSHFSHAYDYKYLRDWFLQPTGFVDPGSNITLNDGKISNFKISFDIPQSILDKEKEDKENSKEKEDKENPDNFADDEVNQDYAQSNQMRSAGM